MSANFRVVGIDPGPTPGIVQLRFHDGALYAVDVVQCSAGMLYPVLRDVMVVASLADLLAVERFVVRGRATADQALTRDQVAALDVLFPGRVVQRSASQVKPWATDERLEAAGLLADVKGMRHAKDATKQALYAAVKDGGIPDPLSREWRRA